MADVSSTSMISIIAIIISLIISLVFPFIALFWIRKLDSIQCKCSENWKRDYMEWYLYFIIALVFINLLMMVFLGYNLYYIIDSVFGKIALSIVFYLLIFAGLSYTVITIDYITKLKQNNCDCSEDIKREITYILQVVLGFLYVFIAFSLLISGIYGNMILSFENSMAKIKSFKK
jgi:SNF family Na+-dependent transporter